MAASAEIAPRASSPYALLRETERAREVLVLTYTASLEFFERFALADARAAGALVTVVSDAAMVRADPASVSRAGRQYLDARAVCPAGAFHPKLLVIVGDGQARIAIGSGNLTMAGWHGNAETWTVFRADADGGPIVLREVSEFLRTLDASPVALSRGGSQALHRVADALDELPADLPGPRLLHSVDEPILDQLERTDGSPARLELYAPFHDAQLAGVSRLLDLLTPAEWTVYVQPDTVVDGMALARLARERGGEVAWVDRHTPDGASDGRYWHGKLAQWTAAGGRRYALTGSPNLSAPALLRAASGHGNVELALLSEVGYDLAPTAGEAPEGGLSRLRGPGPAGESGSVGVTLLSAASEDGLVTVELLRPLASDGAFERYDVVADRWTRAAPVGAGSTVYELPDGSAPLGSALRIRLDDGGLSNEVFVTDFSRVLRAQRRSIGKARVAPEDIPGLGLGAQLLADLDELRPYLLASGIRQISSNSGDGPPPPGGVGSEQPLPAHPTPGPSLDDYLDACDAVIGRSAAEFALVLPALPGVGLTLDDEQGTLDSDSDEGVDDDAGAAVEGRSLRVALRQARPDERERYRRFVERLIERSDGYPPVVRALCVRIVLHSVAAGLWADTDRAMGLLADALRTLSVPGDVPDDRERQAIASLAAAGLTVLRTSVPRMSVADEAQMRYVSVARAVAPLLPDRDQSRLSLLALDLPAELVGAAGVDVIESVVDAVLRPPAGVERAVRLLAEEDEIGAHVVGQTTIVLDEPLGGAPEPMLVRALRLANETGPVFARGVTEEGRAVLAAWCAPVLVVERWTKVDKPMLRIWELPVGATLGTFQGMSLMPKATRTIAAGGGRPGDVAELLELADEDSGEYSGAKPTSG